MEVFLHRNDTRSGGPSSSIRERICDDLISFIWTERATKVGEFELVLPQEKAFESDLISTFLNPDNFYKPLWYVRHSDTTTSMTVDTIHRQADGTVKITGRDPLSWLHVRAIRNLDPIKDDSNDSVLEGVDPSSVVYFYVFQSLYNSADSTSLPIDNVTNFASPSAVTIDDPVSGSVGESIETILDGTNKRLHWGLSSINPYRVNLDIYSGLNRPNVVFSQRNDSLVDVELLISDVDYRDIAWMRTNDLAAQFDLTPVGSSPPAPVLRSYRRWTSLERSDLKGTNAAAIKKMQIASLSELKKRKMINLVTGKAGPISPYVFRTDYNLGDTVYLETYDGYRSATRVTEYTWSLNGEGLENYPTFEAPEA